MTGLNPNRRTALMGAAAFAGAAAFSKHGVGQMRDELARHVAAGEVPGLVALVSCNGETHVETLGTMAVGGTKPMARDTIFRIASITKPITAAAAMVLVDDGRLELDAPVDRWLPELANRRVLRRFDGPLADTVAAHRAITVRDLMTQRLGLGFIMPPGDTPIQAAQIELGVAVAPDPPTAGDPDAFMRAIGSLPLAAHPGDEWLYQTGIEILGVLVARASGQSLEAFMRERLFEPLGMVDTGFSVAPEKLHRLPPAYGGDVAAGQRTIYDPDGPASRYAKPPVFASGGSGLASTADDVAAIGPKMQVHGLNGRERVLSAASVEAMTTDQLTAEQRQASAMFLDGAGWGLGMAAPAADGGGPKIPGGFGWDGGYGTSWRTDPKAGLVGVLLTQQMWTSPTPPAILDTFWASAYRLAEAS
ncbi:serine hydrolase domain-containing protein [Phenylobacterium sp.]|uniref:serine hydrolase domain-containing protein n=1 Tax=Phenylobacterium sp. TaxID=1871053 RepID=UPI00286BF93F|nr:serine hydrolase domain-containing protein [Phenylobacterium sp.]